MNEMKQFKIYNPATGEETGAYNIMDKEAVDKAVEKARIAFRYWSKTDFATRKKIMKKAIGIIADDPDKYASVISSETGKTLHDALLADIYSALDMLKFYAKNAEKYLKPVKGSSGILLPGRKAYYVFEPKGVIGVIAPWNYPFTLASSPVVSAVMAGNAVLLKPSSQTTGSGIIIKEVMEQAGLPENVIQVLTGPGGLTGQALIENQDIDMLFFTGSTEIGKKVNVEAAKRLIPAIMELGGKDVAIVTENANLDRAAHGVLWGGITNSGQTCIGTEIVLVDRTVYDEFLIKITDLAKNLKSGNKGGNVGAMTMKSQYGIVEEQVRDALEKGAQITAEGKIDRSQPGLYFPPTILTGTTPEMKVRTDETFGPLLPIVPYDSISEAIGIANNTEYGLSGAIYTMDMNEGRQIAAKIKTGSININDSLITFAIPSLPFGGVKHSGVGTYHSKSGIRAFTNTKSVTEFNWNLKKELFWYPLPEGCEKVTSRAITAYFSRNIFTKLKAFLSAAFQVWRLRKKGG